MPERLSCDRTVELLREVIAEFGEGFVYEADDRGACKYVRAGEPGCLVGQVLVRAGVPLDELEELDRQIDSSVGMNREQFERWAKSSAVDLLADAQDQQDGGATWGCALDFALEQQIGEVE